MRHTEGFHGRRMRGGFFGPGFPFGGPEFGGPGGLGPGGPGGPGFRGQRRGGRGSRLNRDWRGRDGGDEPLRLGTASLRTSKGEGAPRRVRLPAQPK